MPSDIWIVIFPMTLISFRGIDEFCLLADAENIKIAYIIDVQIIVRDMKCVGDILGTEFCWPKEKKIKYKIAFYPISEVMFPKDMKDKCNPRKRSIIGV